MQAKLRIRLVALLLLGALLAVSCAEERKKQVKQLATQYLDDEVAGNYHDQRNLIDARSAQVLPLPVGELTNPFSPKRMTAYAFKGIDLTGATAQATIKATFQIQYPGGTTGVPEQYDLTIYVVRQPQEWKVDEIRTRTAALDKVMGPGLGSTWLMTEKSKRQFSGQ